jgi:hypothetical protein
MISAECFEKTIISGTKTYPIFIGFLSAADILKVAKVPSFETVTSNEAIAVNVLTPPVKEWQRPLDLTRRDRIATVFNNTGEFMPNPVLLSENVLENRSQIRINQKKISGDVLSNTYVVEIDEPVIGQEKPLWVIDGQHRINGLAISTQAQNLIPVVLLLNKGNSYYSGPVLAKIFAQVTTAAEKLDDIHNEWLTYSFNLGRYTNNENLKKSMQTVALLCSKPSAVDNQTNSFYNNIVFNKSQSSNPAPGGFHYNCIEFSDLFSTYYYSRAANIGYHLEPLELFDQIVLAHNALKQVVKEPKDSVFFGQNIGNKEFWHKIMTDAFFVGLFTYLLRHDGLSSINDYITLFNSLNFQLSDWNFNQWIISLSGGSNQSNSKSIVFKFFEQIFSNIKLPEKVDAIDDFIRGNLASITITYWTLLQNGKPNPTTALTKEYVGGSKRSESINPRTYLKITFKTLNIGKVEVFDKQSPSYNPRIFNLQKGEDISTFTPANNNPLELRIKLFHYGGLESQIDLTLKW